METSNCLLCCPICINTVINSTKKIINSKKTNMETILQKICKQRLLDIAEAKTKISLDEMKRSCLEAKEVLPQIDFYEKLRRSSPPTAILAEVKRASPSKGMIVEDIDAAAQGLAYAQAGVAAISCLTEPTWFKGTLHDMLAIRKAIDSLPDRPAVLRKDFILDAYQIYEARVYGADTVLLIVAALSESDLRDLYQICRSVDIEPLVEINNKEELQKALKLNAKIIGINNRNLHDFSVDLRTTGNLLSGEVLPPESLWIALSGIHSRKDVLYFEHVGVKAVLVGEALMRAPDPLGKIWELQGYAPPPLVKICGIKDIPTALGAAEAGADLIGLMFTKSSRQISRETGKDIVAALTQWKASKTGRKLPKKLPEISSVSQEISQDPQKWFQFWMDQMRGTAKPLIVGVFCNNSIEEVNDILTEVGLDIVQLHGNESQEFIQKVRGPCWKVLHVGPSQRDIVDSSVEELSQSLPTSPVALLLDTQTSSGGSGGTGKTFNWTIGREFSMKFPMILAGGLDPSNVKEAIEKVECAVVDVSSGVEENGEKNAQKIQNFIRNAKSARVPLKQS